MFMGMPISCAILLAAAIVSSAISSVISIYLQKFGFLTRTRSATGVLYTDVLINIHQYNFHTQCVTFILIRRLSIGCPETSSFYQRIQQPAKTGMHKQVPLYLPKCIFEKFPCQ